MVYTLLAMNAGNSSNKEYISMEPSQNDVVNLAINHHEVHPFFFHFSKFQVLVSTFPVFHLKHSDDFK